MKMKGMIKIARELVRIARLIAARKKTFMSFDDIKDFTMITEDTVADIGDLVMPFIWKYLNEYNFDKNDAEDIRQEFVIEVLKMIRNGYFQNNEYIRPEPGKPQRGIAKMSTFFFRIAEHCILMHFKKNRMLAIKTQDGKQKMVRSPRKFVPIVEDTQNYVDNAAVNREYKKYMDEALQEIMPEIVDAIEEVKNRNEFYYSLIVDHLRNGKTIRGMAKERGMNFSNLAHAYEYGAKKMLREILEPAYNKFREALFDIARMHRMRMSGDFVEDVMSKPEVWKAYDEKYGRHDGDITIGL